MSATTRKGRRVAAARYPHQAVRGSPGVGGQRPPSTHKAPKFALVSLFGYFQLYLEYELVYRRYRTITAVPACTGTAVPPLGLHQAENRGKSHRPHPLRRPALSLLVGVETPRQLAPFDRASLSPCVSATHRRQRARRTMKLLVALSLFGAAAAVELTPDKRSSGVPSLAYIRSNALAHPAQLGRHDRWQDGLYQIPGALVRALQEDETCVGRRHGGLRGPPHEARR